jgi:MoxR-like ATPase
MANAVSNQMGHTLLKKFVLSELLSGKEQEFSYMIEGSHGIGKSAFFVELALEYDGFFIDLRLGQRDLGDILGMPIVTEREDGTQRFSHIKPDLIRNAFVKDLSELGLIGDANDILAKKRSADKIGKPYKFICFLADEYNRGTKDVQQSMFELVYDRRMSGEKVNPNCWIFAACNDNMEVYTVTEGDPAFRSRFKTIKYNPSVEEWLDWGKKTGELAEELLHVFKVKKELADPPPKADIEVLNQPHPNRRSWHQFSKFYVLHRKDFTAMEMRDICATFVGGDTAEVFRLLVDQMKTTEKKHDANAKTETTKIQEISEQFFKFQRMDVETCKKKLAGLNPSEADMLADTLVNEWGNFRYITGGLKEQIFQFSNIATKEFFSKIWNSVNDQYGFKGKMVGYAGSKGLPEHFNGFQKI